MPCPAAYGLTGSVAVLDVPLGESAMLSSPSALTLAALLLHLGTDLAAARVSADRKTLFALSRGVQPQRTPDDENPELQLIDGDSKPKVSGIHLDRAHESAGLDPKNEWAVVLGSSGVVGI